MSEKSKFVKVGELRKSKAGNEYIMLGSENSQKPEYNFEVQVMVKNSKGEKVALVKNPRLFFNNPRRPKEDGTVPNVPDFILETVGFTLED
jgi:hypothetical protein